MTKKVSGLSTISKTMEEANKKTNSTLDMHKRRKSNRKEQDALAKRYFDASGSNDYAHEDYAAWKKDPNRRKFTTQD